MAIQQCVQGGPLCYTTLRRAGADLEAIQKLLGHASIKTTQVYAALADELVAQTLALLPTTWIGTNGQATATTPAPPAETPPSPPLPLPPATDEPLCPMEPAGLSWAARLLLTLGWANG